MDISFYNIFLNTHISGEYFDLQCVFDSEAVNSNTKRQDQMTHTWKLKGEYRRNSLLLKEWTVIDDIIILLSLWLWNQVFTDRNTLGRIGQNKHDFSLLMQNDIEAFMSQSISTIEWLSPDYRNILISAILTHYQIRYLLRFDDLKDILLMNCFESLISSIYRIDNNINDNQTLEFGVAYSYLLKKFSYQTYIDQKLSSEIEWKNIKEFKQERQIKNISDFSDQFRKMRNWIAHWKNHKKPDFPNSPSNSTFTFSYRLESFIRIILIDLVYGLDYKRKFDVLYQLILEVNVIPVLTPEFPNLRFNWVSKSNFPKWTSL